MLKKQKDIHIYFQYKFLQEFKNNFNKQDKIAVLNHDDFYELKKLSAFGYDIDALSADYIFENDISNYDYVFLIKKYYQYQQKNDNYNKNESNKTSEEEYFCKHYVKKINNEFYPMFKICHFDWKLLYKKGFIFDKRMNIENMYVDIYKKLPIK